jgi:hypothetical protein
MRRRRTTTLNNSTVQALRQSHSHSHTQLDKRFAQDLLLRAVRLQYTTAFPCLPSDPPARSLPTPIPSSTITSPCEKSTPAKSTRDREIIKAEQRTRARAVRPGQGEQKENRIVQESRRGTFSSSPHIYREKTAMVGNI